VGLDVGFSVFRLGAAVGIIDGRVFPCVPTAALFSSWKLKNVDDFVAMNCDGKEQLGGRKGLQSLLMVSHCPEQQGMATFI